MIRKIRGFFYNIFCIPTVTSDQIREMKLTFFDTAIKKYFYFRDDDYNFYKIKKSIIFNKGVDY